MDDLCQESACSDRCLTALGRRRRIPVKAADLGEILASLRRVLEELYQTAQVVEAVLRGEVMRAWMIVMLLAMALEGLCVCVFLLRNAYPRTCQRWEDVVSLATIVGLLAWGVVAFRGG